MSFSSSSSSPSPSTSTPNLKYDPVLDPQSISLLPPPFAVVHGRSRGPSSPQLSNRATFFVVTATCKQSHLLCSRSWPCLSVARSEASMPSRPLHHRYSRQVSSITRSTISLSRPTPNNLRTHPPLLLHPAVSSPYAFVAENQIPPYGSGRRRTSLLLVVTGYGVMVTRSGLRLSHRCRRRWDELQQLPVSFLLFPYSGEANGRFATNWVAWPWTVAIASGRKGGLAMDGSYYERLEGRLCRRRGAVDGLDAVGRLSFSCPIKKRGHF